MKRTFCDGCDQQITFNDKNEPTRDARVDLRVNFYCLSPDGHHELGQFASERLDLCRSCIDHMKGLIDPRKWPRAAKAA
jgi:hypothetical protein